jgi:hypothetical protein
MKYLLALLLATTMSNATTMGLQGYQPTVAPLLDAEWGQLYPWNSYCPDGAPTGCVAVSVAQVMYYYKSPAHGYGEDYNDYIHWDRIDPVAPTDGAAKLLYEVGHSLGAHRAILTPINIGAIPGRGGAGHVHWNYCESSNNVFRNAYTDYDWHKLLQFELESGHPLVYGGRGTGAHSFVIDGYDVGTGSAPEYHVNWGAEGRWDGWYRLDDLTPGPFDFTDNQHMLINFYPREVCLRLPRDLSVDVDYERAMFLWYHLGNSYTIQVSEYETMHGLVINKRNLYAPVFATPELEHETTYYWRVYIYGGEFEGWSRINSFTTGSKQ